MSSDTSLETSLFRIPSQLFAEHLSIPNNERIIFSGKFGIGKTTFLRRHFFQCDTLSALRHTTQYNVIHIFPVNYSVAQNEDIFRYIKYDILIELLRNQVDIESLDLSFVDSLPGFIRNNSLEILSLMVRLIPNIGKDISELITASNQLFDKFKAYHKECKEFVNDGDKAVTFLEQVEHFEGSIYEAGVITKLIERVLTQWKKSRDPRDEDQVENVLIIDDLDRLDPEHIFRVLNVFAANFDNSVDGMPNKFGFDKVIIVCDIYNIRQIFRSKFGLHVDFNGYIDKFYSSHVFEFYPYRELKKFIEKYIFEKLQVKESYDTRQRSLGQISDKRAFFEGLLNDLVKNNDINLRNILKLEGKAIYESLPVQVDGATIPWGLEILVFYFQILCLIKGDPQGLCEVILKNKGSIWTEELVENYAGACLYLNYFLARQKPSTSDETKIDTRLGDRDVKVTVTRPDDSYFPVFKIGALDGSDTLRIDDKLVRKIIVETIGLLHGRGLI